MASLLAGRRPANLGAKDGRLAPPKSTPNCVSSQADAADRGHYVAPIAFRAGAAEAMAAAAHAVKSLDGSSIVRQTDHYLYAECRSRLLGYVDDLELLFEEAGGLFQVRSASRLGRRDFGVNRKRVEALRALLAR
ncbi:MAG TPA: DUF1499 domain-containing protein [Burkholderiales bacterium]|nr:DUF1499 domain-containing protein [Burkholderiales bacterium]